MTGSVVRKGVRQNSLFEENVAYDSYFAAFGIGRISIRPSLRVSTQFIGHNVHMTGREFATLAEMLK